MSAADAQCNGLGKNPPPLPRGEANSPAAPVASEAAVLTFSSPVAISRLEDSDPGSQHKGGPDPEQFGLTLADIGNIETRLERNRVLTEFEAFRNVCVLLGFLCIVFFSKTGGLGFWGPLLTLFVLCASASSVANWFLDMWFVGSQRLDVYRRYSHSLAEWKTRVAALAAEQSRWEEAARRLAAAKELELRRRQLEYWKSLSGSKFEQEMAHIFETAGYEARITGSTGDGGVDIILKVNGHRILVQCKRHSKPVGPAPIRELYGVMVHRKVRYGVVVSPEGFTAAAVKFSTGKSITLMDVSSILQLIDGTFRLPVGEYV